MKYKVNFTCPRCGGHELARSYAISGWQVVKVDCFDVEDNYFYMERKKVLSEDLQSADTIRWECQEEGCFFTIEEPYFYGNNNEYEGTQTPSDKYIFNWLKGRGMIEECTTK
jgi:hypothetical protein